MKQTTAALRLSVLRQHIQEVSDQVSKERGSEGFNESSNANVLYLRDLFGQLERYEKNGATGINGGVSVGRLVPVRNVR